MTFSRRGLLAASLGLCAACSNPARPSHAGHDACTTALTGDLTGFDAAKLQACLDDFSSGPVNFHGLVIQRGGHFVAERYRAGSDRPNTSIIERRSSFDACALHDVRSISKSITSLLWGIAAGQGKTPALDTPVLSLYPRLSRLNGEGREKITIRHLLTMSSGLKWDEENYANPVNDEERLYWTGDQARYVFDRPMAAEAGARFNYNGGCTAVIADLLTRAVGATLPAFAEAELFAPLGITEWRWVRDHRGRATAFAGLRLKPRDMAKIGQLVLDGGQWDGRAIVPAAWIADSIAPHIETGDGLRYGYFWWLGQVDALGGAHDYIAGFGNGGQRIFVAPSLQLVVAITSGNYNRPEQRRSKDLFRSIAAALSA